MRSPKSRPGQQGDTTAGIAEYERLRKTAGRGERRSGLGVLVARGMVAFLNVAASLAAAAASRNPAPVPPRAHQVPAALDTEIVRVWSRMVLAHAHSP